MPSGQVPGHTETRSAASPSARWGWGCLESPGSGLVWTLDACVHVGLDEDNRAQRLPNGRTLTADEGTAPFEHRRETLLPQHPAHLALPRDLCHLVFTSLAAAVGPEAGDLAPLSLSVPRGKVGAAGSWADRRGRRQ